MTWTRGFVTLALFVSACQGACITSPSCYVNTTQGPVEGCLKETAEGRQYCSFVGLRYGAPPTGEYRFQAPRPATAVSSLTYANVTPPACPQIQPFPSLPHYNHVIGGEDCLFLNIFTPQVRNCSDIVRPILFYIHEGQYFFGTGTDEGYVSPYLLLDREVVLVAANYRLGALGWASTGDCVVSGNFGLKDLALALRFTYVNAQKFGGDPNRITVLGDGHGANLAQLLFHIPQARIFLNSAVLGSGNFDNPYAIGPQPNVTMPTKELAKICGCPTDTSEALVECMQKVSYKKIVQNQLKVYPNADIGKIFGTLWAPVVENSSDVGAVLTADPTVSTCCKTDYPLLRGVSTYDGGFYTACVLDPETGLVARFNDDRVTTIINLLQLDLYFCKGCIRKVAAEIDQYFFKGLPISHCSEFQLDAMFGSWYYFFGEHYNALQHTGPQYFYQYNAKLSVTFNTLLPSNLSGVPTRADVTLAFFPVDILFKNRTYPAADEAVIFELIKTVVSFATVGEPDAGADAPWSTVQPTGRITYRALSNNGSVQYPDYLPEDVQFFYYLFAKYPYKQNPATDYKKC